MIALTRRYRFAAAHVLRSERLSEDENQRTYGKCANPNGHGHDYAFEVTVTGELDGLGRVVDPRRFDSLVDERIVRRFSHRMLNDDPIFADAVPTAENIARAIHHELAGQVRERLGARLLRVRVQETRRNSFDYGDLH